MKNRKTKAMLPVIAAGAALVVTHSLKSQDPQCIADCESNFASSLFDCEYPRSNAEYEWNFCEIEYGSCAIATYNWFLYRRDLCNLQFPDPESPENVDCIATANSLYDQEFGECADCHDEYAAYIDAEFTYFGCILDAQGIYDDCLYECQFC